MITGKTLIKREVYDEPKGGNQIGTIPAKVQITATENINQWLHLIDGGWVSAGARQQYIKWQYAPGPVVPPAPTDPLPPPVPPPSDPLPPPVATTLITEIKRKGRIATLLVDWQNPKWEFAPRQILLGRFFAHPQTVTFNSVCDRMKGSRIPLTNPILDHLGRLNGKRTIERILTPQAGWINNPTVPPTVERLTWAANLVVVTETRVEQGVEYSNVYAASCYATDLSGSFFDKDMRLIIHKFNALTRRRSMIKLTRGHDCYTPFITDPDVNNGDMWIRSDYLEMWPELPFTLSDGTQIVEYELYGYKIYGIRADRSAVLLRDPQGFKTNWKINSPELPV